MYENFGKFNDGGSGVQRAAHGEPDGDGEEVQGAKEQVLTNIAINRMHGHRLKTAWIDVKKGYDSVNHEYLIKCIERLNMAPWITRMLKTLIGKWKMRITDRQETIMEKKIGRGYCRETVCRYCCSYCDRPAEQETKRNLSEGGKRGKTRTTSATTCCL